MQEQNKSDRIKELIKGYLPVAALILLTIFLMIFFRYHKRGLSRLIEEGKNNLVSFYAQNLKPLFATTEISNEDVFNFALYQSLPIDKINKKVLLVSSEEEGSQVFEIKPASYNPDTYNYERFVGFLNLNPEQKLIADSILGAYKKEIYLSILMNDKNTIAINPKLSDLQQAVLADLLAFSEKVSSEKTYELFPNQYKLFSRADIKSFASKTKDLPRGDYIFITPDTVFQTECTIDSKEFDKLMDIDLNKQIALQGYKNLKVDVHISNLEKKAEKSLKEDESKFWHQMDSNLVQVVIPIPKIREAGSISINDSVRIKLKKASDKLKMFTVKWEDQNKKLHSKVHVSPPKPPSKGEALQFQFNIDPGAFTRQAVEMALKGNYKDLEKLGIRMDSIAKAFEKSLNDSLKRAGKYNYDGTKSKSSRTNVWQKDSTIKK
ncbi:MAG: hypothetical protein RDU14_14915 [Melioribacteraceae bacterium]|nr:hypothetical protein [Melioribacteraceae bacterium]